MLKVKTKHLGKKLKKDGITILLHENLNQNELEFIQNRFGKDYVQKKREAIKEEDVKDNQEPSE